jgi:hypothetical protein
MGSLIVQRPRAVPLRRCRLRRLCVCGGIQHNGVLCKACAPVKAPALRVRIRDLYVSRPAGKSRHTSQSQRPSPSSRGSKTGLVLLRPFAFCCMVVPVYVLSCCGRFAAYVGGAFPLTPPHPPSGQVKQRHGRTRPHCHPLPWVNLHPRAPSAGLRPASPAGSRRDGQGEAMLIRSATPVCFCEAWSLRGIVHSGSAFCLSRQRHGAGMKQKRLHRHATAAVCGSCASTKKPCRTKPRHRLFHCHTPP